MFISKKLKKQLQKNTEYLIAKEKQLELRFKNIETELLIQKNEILKLKNQKPKEEKNYEKIFENNKPKLTMREMIDFHLKGGKNGRPIGKRNSNTN